MLALFYSVSGLKINMSKSIILGVGVDDALVSSMAESVGCEVGAWPINYLGLPLGGNPYCRAFWDPVVCKVAKRLDGWKRAFFV